MRLRIDNTLVEVEDVALSDEGDYKDHASEIAEAIFYAAPWATKHMPDPFCCPRDWWKWLEDARHQQHRWDSFDAFIAAG